MPEGIMFYDDEKFCANPPCPLHVSPNDNNVVGRGDWAELQSGLIFARVECDGHYYCHVCADDPSNPPIADLFASNDSNAQSE